MMNFIDPDTNEEVEPGQLRIKPCISHQPQVCMIELSWIDPKPQDYLNVEGIIPFCFDSWDIFNGAITPGFDLFIYEIKSMVMYTGSHYFAVVNKYGSWYEINDHVVTPIEWLSPYLYSLAKKGIRPSLLVYDKVAEGLSEMLVEQESVKYFFDHLKGDHQNDLIELPEEAKQEDPEPGQFHQDPSNVFLNLNSQDLV